MNNGGFSKARLGRMHDVMAGHVERSGMQATRDDLLAVPGQFGWDGGLGAS